MESLKNDMILPGHSLHRFLDYNIAPLQDDMKFSQPIRQRISTVKLAVFDVQ